MSFVGRVVVAEDSYNDDDMLQNWDDTEKQADCVCIYCRTTTLTKRRKKLVFQSNNNVLCRVHPFSTKVYPPRV